MHDMKNYRLTWRERHADGIHMAMTAGGMLVLGLMFYALLILTFSIRGY